MSAWTIKLDNLLEEIKYAIHAGDSSRARVLVAELTVMVETHSEEAHS